MDTIRRLQPRYGYELLSVSSFNHVHDLPGHLTVGDESQAADIAVANLAGLDDVVVTQDWGLAAMVLGRGARAIAPDGRVFAEATIAFLLEERHLKAKFRRSGGRTRGPAARTKEDDMRFMKAFMGLVEG